MSPAEIEKAVCALPFYGKLSAAERQGLSRSMVPHRYAAGTFLENSDRACAGLIFVVSGRLRAYIVSKEGREITLFRLERGEVCVLSAACVLYQITFETELCTETASEVLTLNSGAFKRLMDQNIEVRCFAYELMAERFSTVMWVFQQILFEKFDRRLAGFLLSETGKSGKQEIRMTQEQIAVEVNSAREVVARMLKSFAADGLIETGGHAVVIKNREGLRRIVE